MLAGISAVSYVLPERRSSTLELAEKFGFEAEFISRKLGISERRFVDADETCSVMATRAAKSLLAKASISAGDIDFLVVVTQNPDFKLPHTSSLVHRDLGLPVHAGALDVSLGCSGFVYAAALAQGLVAAGQAKKVLVVTSDQYSRIVEPSDRATAPLFGDAAAAAVIAADGASELLAFDFGTDGQRFDALIVRDKTLHMNGRAIFEFAIRTVPQSVRRCLDKAALSDSQIDYFVFHQGSRYIVDSLRERLKLPEEKVIVDIDGVGNTVSSTLPICLSNLQDRVDLRGRNLLLCGFGVGLSWATTVLRYR